MRRRRLTVLMFLGLLVAAGPASAQDVGLPIGSTPEAVQVEDLDGNAVDLSKHVGKRATLIQFWATWCPICEVLEPQLKAAKQRYGNALDVVIVAVGVNQSTRSIKRHTATHAMAGPVYFDARGRAVRAYKAPSTSYIVALDASGKVVYTGVGEEQDIAAAAARAVGRR